MKKSLLIAYENALEYAKQNRINIWENFNPEEERQRKMLREAESNKQEKLSLKVTYVVDGNWFFAQFNNKELTFLEPLMKDLQIWNNSYKKKNDFYFKLDDLCCHKRKSDGIWYRVRIHEKISNWQYNIFYIDFGYADIVDKNDLRLLPEQFNLNVLPAQAKECYLALVKVPSLTQDYGDIAASYLTELIEGKTLLAQIEYRNLENNTFFMSLADIENKIHINKAMVLSGLALVKKVNRKQCEKLLEQLLEEQEKARKERRNQWSLGDIYTGEDEDDDE